MLGLRLVCWFEHVFSAPSHHIPVVDPRHGWGGQVVKKNMQKCPHNFESPFKNIYTPERCIFTCALISKHSPGGRILTSVVVIWFCRKSRSPLSVSRLRDAVCRFFSRRAWASSMSYSNMTLAFKGGKKPPKITHWSYCLNGRTGFFFTSGAYWPPTIGRLSRWVEPRPCRKHYQPTWSVSPWVLGLPGKTGKSIKTPPTHC